jgi:hypothetical protein
MSRPVRSEPIQAEPSTAKMPRSRPTNSPHQAPPAEPAGDPLDLAQVRTDDRHVLDGELLVGEEVDGGLGPLVGVEGTDLHAAEGHGHRG